MLGAKRKTLAGFSTAAAVRAGDLHAGFVYASELVQQTPPALRQRAVRLVGGKCTLMARVDAFGEDPAGRATPPLHPTVLCTRCGRSAVHPAAVCSALRPSLTLLCAWCCFARLWTCRLRKGCVAAAVMIRPAVCASVESLVMGGLHCARVIVSISSEVRVGVAAAALNRRLGAGADAVQGEREAHAR